MQQFACLVSLIYMYEHGHHKKKTFIWCTEGCVGSCRKKHYYRLIFLNMSSWMCVFYSVCDRSGLLSLSVFRPTRAAQRSAAHARICVKTAWEWESNAAYIGISPHKQERERQRERETAPMSLQRTFSPAREAERCLETAASTGSSRAHQLRKRGT